jgi:hypothetical protein
MLQVKDTNLGVSRAGDQRAVARMRHELDGEDVGMVTGADTCVQREGLRGSVGIVVPDVQVGVIGAGSEEAASGRPTARAGSVRARGTKEGRWLVPESVDASGVCTQLVDYVEIVDPGAITVERADRAVRLRRSQRPLQQSHIEWFVHACGGRRITRRPRSWSTKRDMRGRAARPQPEVEVTCE